MAPFVQLLEDYALHSGVVFLFRFLGDGSSSSQGIPGDTLEGQEGFEVSDPPLGFPQMWGQVANSPGLCLDGTGEACHKVDARSIER